MRGFTHALTRFIHQNLNQPRFCNSVPRDEVLKHWLFTATDCNGKIDWHCRSSIMFMDAQSTNFTSGGCRARRRGNRGASLTRRMCLITRGGQGTHEWPWQDQHTAGAGPAAVSSYQAPVLRKNQIKMRENRT